MLIIAGVMAILSILGFWHLRKVNPREELLAKALRLPAETVGV